VYGQRRRFFIARISEHTRCCCSSRAGPKVAACLNQPLLVEHVSSQDNVRPVRGSATVCRIVHCPVVDRSHQNQSGCQSDTDGQGHRSAMPEASPTVRIPAEMPCPEPDVQSVIIRAVGIAAASDRVGDLTFMLR